MRQWIVTAGSLEEAVGRGLKRAGLARDEVQVDLLEETRSSLMSMMDFSRVRVRLTEKPRAGARPEPRSVPGRGEPGRDVRPREDRRPERDRRPDHDRHPDHDRRPDHDKRPERGRRDNGFQGRRPQDRAYKGSRPQAPSGRPQSPDPRQRPPRPDVPARSADPRAGFPRPDFRPKPAEAPPAPRPAEAPPREKSAVNITPEDLMAQWKAALEWPELEVSTAPGESGRLTMTLNCPDPAKAERLFGRGGETLEAWEYLFNLALSRLSDEAAVVEFRLDGFEDPKIERIRAEARRAAATVKRTGSAYRLDPMDAPERRLVHQTLAQDPDVETVSEGEGPWRKVVVRPRPKKPN
jgi:spoIIIJ-associated protein